MKAEAEGSIKGQGLCHNLGSAGGSNHLRSSFYYDARDPTTFNIERIRLLNTSINVTTHLIRNHRSRSKIDSEDSIFNSSLPGHLAEKSLSENFAGIVNITLIKGAGSEGLTRVRA
jgi:hypothetical protein